jgi:hypothetical protein
MSGTADKEKQMSTLATISVLLIVAGLVGMVFSWFDNT